MSWVERLKLLPPGALEAQQSANSTGKNIDLA
jgi:hypothetical protein